MSKSSKSVSLSELGRSLGVSCAAIRKAIQTGRIPAALVGSKEATTGRKVRVILDAVAARAAFVGSTSATPVSRELEVLKPSAAAVPDNDSSIPSIAESRARREFANARLAEIEVERESGRLVDAEELHVQLATMIVAARTQILAVPSKAKVRIPHLSVDDIAILSGLLRDALEAVADERQDEAIRSEGTQS